MPDSPKKQIPLRLSQELYDAVSQWAEEDFRSVNGQIEFLLTQCVRYHHQNGQRFSSPSAGLPTAQEDESGGFR